MIQNLINRKAKNQDGSGRNNDIHVVFSEFTWPTVFQYETKILQKSTANYVQTTK